MKLYSNRAGSIYHIQSNYDCYVPTSQKKRYVTYKCFEYAEILEEGTNII